MEKIYRKNEEKFFYSSFDDKGGFDDSKKMDMSDLRLVSKNQLKLEKMLGRGAFGTVHKGYYMPFNENNCKVRVAIKVLNKCKFSDEKSIAKLSDELINVFI
jgi:serine/threonine protein kinase